MDKTEDNEVNQDGFAPGQDLTFSDLAQIRAGKTDPAAPAISREDIAKMARADVVDLLEMHGAETEGKLDVLRDRLVKIMFVEA